MLSTYSSAQYQTIHLGLQQGMSNGKVNSFTQDRLGRVWMATEGGLHCWDGFRFRVYDTENSSLDSNELNVVFADSDFIYVGMRRDGLYRLDVSSGEWKKWTRNEGLLSNAVTALQSDGKGGLWISYYLRGVDHMDCNGAITHYGNENIQGLPDPNWCSVFDGNGKLYIGHVMNGLSVVNISDMSFVNYTDTLDSWLRSTEVGALCWASDGNLWVGTNKGVYIYNPQSGKCESFTPTESNVVELVRTRDGSMLVGEYGKGEYAIMEDRDGNVWKSDGQDGLNVMLHEHPLFTSVDTVFPTYSFQGAPPVRDCFQSGGIYYLATPDGLWTVDKAGTVKERKDINSQMDVIFSNAVRVDRQGKIWIGTFGSGIYVFSSDGKLVSHMYSDPSPDISMMEIDSKGRIWAATREGLARFDNTEKPQSSVVYGREDGFANPFILALCEDRNGRIWVSNNGGISCISPDSGQIFNFTFAEGIPYHAFLERKVMKLPDGRIAFGQEEEACVFNPADVDSKSVPARFFFSDFMLLRQISDNGKAKWESVATDRWHKLRFPHDENSFRIELGVVDISDAGATEFQYRLKGVDNQWYGVSPERVIELHSVSPGSYELQVRSRVYNSEWSEPEVFPFTVCQPWWWSVWMKLVYVLILALAACYAWRSYQQRIRTRRLLSERLATMYALSPQKPAVESAESDDVQSRQQTEPASDADAKDVKVGSELTLTLDSSVKTPDSEDSGADKSENVNQAQSGDEDQPESEEKNDVDKVKEMKLLDREFLNKIDRVILDNLTEKELDIQFLTEHMFTSHSTLYRKMKALTGMSINEYVRKHRLMRAMQLLGDGHMVNDVSDLCGFNSVNYFRRCFKTEYGMLPSEV